MTDQTKMYVLCSKTSSKFTLLFDGAENYYLFYDGEQIADVNDAIHPVTLHKQTKEELIANIRDNPNDYSKIAVKIVKTLDNHFDESFHIMRVFKTLIGTLKDASKEETSNLNNFRTAPNKVKDRFRDLTSNYADGDADSILDDIINPVSIEDAIQQRVNPILTNKEKAKADAIAEQVNKIGLLPYLKNILDNIHKGEHKNIYRKILAEFNVMRGAGSYFIETTAKAEAGKSFEDEIVFDNITPQRYIFEVNDMTLASFVRYALINPDYFNRMTITFGDKGGKKSFKQIEDILNAVKPMITENKYKYIKSNKDNDIDVIELLLTVDSIAAVYQTTQNSFTEDDDQLISRTLFSTPAKVEPKDIAEQIFYLEDEDSKQSEDESKAKQDLRDFGLYLMQMVNNDVKIKNPYFDEFWEYAEKSETPIREFKQQRELFKAYCILTQDKCKSEPLGYLFASEEQLKEYMDYINLENALIPYEYDFLDMLLAKGKSKELTILYNDFDLIDEDGNMADIDFDAVTTLTECENNALELINYQIRQKTKNKLKSNGFDEYEIEEKLKDFEPIETKADLTQSQLKGLTQKLLAIYGFRNAGANHKSTIFFRYSDLKNYYGKRTAYKNIDNVPQLLQTLHNKGYLGKYELKHSKENLYYLTPKCENLTTDFKLKKSYDRYVTDYYLNAGLYR